MTPYSASDNTDALLTLPNCKLTPQGVASVIYHLRQHSLFKTVPEDRLRAMVFAFLAHGGTNDNNHGIDPGSLHPIHYQAHRTSKRGESWRYGMGEKYLALCMDMLTWLDRLSGGATVMIHSPATHLPGTWAIPEEALLDVFLPRFLIHERPALRAVCAHLVQYFAQHVATAAMERWDHAKGVHVSGPLDDAGVPRSSFNEGHAQPLIPLSPTPRYLFYGRGAGVVDLLVATEGLTQLPPPTPPLLAPTSSAPSPSPAQAADRKYSTRPEPPFGEPQSTQYADDNSWTEVDLDAWVASPTSELSPSDSASRQASDSTPRQVSDSASRQVSDSASRQGSDSAARQEITRMALGVEEIVSDFVSRIQELEHTASIQEAELSKLRTRCAASSSDNGGDMPAVPSSGPSYSSQDRPRSEVEPPTNRKGKAPAQGSSASSSLSLALSNPPSPTSTVCDASSSYSAVIPGPTLPLITSVSQYTSGDTYPGMGTGPRLASLYSTSISPVPSPSPVLVSPSQTLPYTPEDVPFGIATNDVVRRHQMAGRTHGYLRRILQDYAPKEWIIGVETYLNVDEDVANELVAAMRQDRS